MLRSETPRSWVGAIAPSGPKCTLPCTLWLPGTPDAELHLTAHGEDDPEYELDRDDLEVLVSGLMVGPREKTVLSIDGYER